MPLQPAQPPLPDSVDRLLQAWAAEEPDLPVAPVGVITRLARVRARLDEELSRLFERYDLSSADFAVIAALRRAGRPYQLPQAVLMERLGLTSGTVSVRLTRLVGKDVVTRDANPSSGRGTLVRLTAHGLELFDQVGPAHLHNEDVLLSALTDAERDQLAALLRTLLVSFEHEHSASPLGMTVAPAHVARRMRAAVGLSDTAGLLVTDVVRGSVADSAGLEAGDLLTHLDGQELRSCITFAERVRDAGSRPVSVEALRGDTSRELRIPSGVVG